LDLGEYIFCDVCCFNNDRGIMGDQIG